MSSLSTKSVERSAVAAGGAQRTRVYLDYHASTPCDPRVVEAMLPYFIEFYANPSSAVHAQGREAADAVERARQQVAEAIGASAGEIIFTSGATESNNLAIQGVARAAPAGRRKILASAIEHKSVLEVGKALQGQGFEFKTIPVEADGLIDLGELANLVDETTLLVSVQAANNEIGTIQPILEVAQVAHRVGALVHCDAAQALGRIPIDVGLWGVDFLSVSAHKCYGPKGVGALYMRGGPRVTPLGPITHGGGHEGRLRPGTLNVTGIVGFGHASEIAQRELADEAARVARLRNRFEELILAELSGVKRNGAHSRRLPGNSSLLFDGVEAEALIVHMPDIAVSTGSACTSGAPEPSHVLTAIGLSRGEAYSTIRVGLGRFTTAFDVQYSVSRLVGTARQVRKLGSVG